VFCGPIRHLRPENAKSRFFRVAEMGEYQPRRQPGGMGLYGPAPLKARVFHAEKS